VRLTKNNTWAYMSGLFLLADKGSKKNNTQIAKKLLYISDVAYNQRSTPRSLFSIYYRELAAKYASIQLHVNKPFVRVCVIKNLYLTLLGNFIKNTKATNLEPYIEI